MEDNLDEDWRKLDSAWSKGAQKEFLKNIHKKHSYAYLDYIVERNQHLEKCVWDKDPHAQKTFLCSALAGELSLDENNRVFMLNRPVYFKLKK